MKKFKRFFAVLLALAMVLGMSMTTFAEPKATGTITINGLSANGDTTINVYQAVYMQTVDGGSEWAFASWAEGLITPGESLSSEEAEALGEAVAGTPYKTTTDGTFSNSNTTWTLQNVPAGAYVITATTTKDGKQVAAYTTMVASTFATTAGNDVAKDETITAKASSFTLDKELENAADKVAAYGEEISFTIQTTVPDLKNATSYTIKDRPDGLRIKEVTELKVGGDSVTPVSTGYVGEDYVIDLSGLKGNSDHAGKVLTVKYTAVVTSSTGYSNTANYFVDDVKQGEGDTTNGFTGSITVTKVDSATSAVLSGAKFTVTKTANDTANGAKNTISLNETLKFTGEAGSYTYDKDGTVEEVEVGEDGTVTISGLDGGTYHFTETKAPEGYQIADNANNECMTDAVLTEANATGNITAGGNYTNTRLSSLPSTGGIGTTIFTIGGCAIMIIAAALFFASRRKAAK